MAQRVESFRILVPAGILPAKPRVFNLNFLPGVVTEVEFVIPNGHVGLTGVRLTMAGTPLLPVTVGSWIVSNNEVIRWPLEDFLDTGAWGAEAYNEDIFQHNFFIRFLVDQPVPKEAAKPPGSLAAPAAIPAEQIESGIGAQPGEAAPESGSTPEQAGEAPEAPGEAELTEPAPAEPEPAQPPPGEPAPAAPAPGEPAPPAPAPAEPEPPAAPSAEPTTGEPSQGEPAPAEPGGKPAPANVPEVPSGLTVEQQIDFYESGIKRLERLVAGVQKQIRANPRSPAVPDWRIVLEDYKRSIAHMKQLLVELRKQPRKAPALVHAHPGPGAGRGPAKHEPPVVHHPPHPKPHRRR